MMCRSTPGTSPTSFNSKDGAIDRMNGMPTGKPLPSFNSKDGAIDSKAAEYKQNVPKCFNSKDGAIDSKSTVNQRFILIVSIPKMVRLIGGF